MAVVKVVGEVDGTSVIFKQDGEDNWSIPVPLDKDGEYVVSVTAYDEAGNKAYSSAILFIVNATDLEVDIIPLQFAFKVEKNETNSQIFSKEFVYYEIETEHEYSTVISDFYSEVI